jgi:threonine synthase
MRYRSTRGDGSKDYSFEQALLSGYAPDGGLFVPVSLPTLTATEHLIPWSKLNFPQLAHKVLVRATLCSSCVNIRLLAQLTFLQLLLIP